MSNVKVWFQSNLDHAEEIDFCGGTVMAYSRRCPDKLTPNEDSAAVIELSEKHGLLVIADGVGGANAGDQASRTVIETLVESVESAPAEESLRSQILDAIEKANRLVLEWKIGAGSTLLIGEYLNGTLRTFHAGDSTALVCSNRGNVKYVTVAHAPVAMAVEAGLMDEIEGINHEERHLINNCVGTEEMKIELGPVITLAARDTVVLGSDGLFDNLITDEIVSRIQGGKLQSGVENLIELCSERMHQTDRLPSKPDDLSILCFRQ